MIGRSFRALGSLLGLAESGRHNYLKSIVGQPKKWLKIGFVCISNDNRIIYSSACFSLSFLCDKKFTFYDTEKKERKKRISRN